jgi:phosphoserine phosphatase RsbU/P
MNNLNNLDINTIIDSINEGIYVCDLERKIIFWNKSAEKLTGWPAEEVVGRSCSDNILCHINKDGHRLCGKEFCPLHRAMITDSKSKNSVLVYARAKDRRRVPLLVGVAPLQNDHGEVIGGVETFRDASAMVSDLEKSKAIQELSLLHDLPEDPRIRFTSHYRPSEIVGGDYYAYTQLDENRYGFMLADVMGHGVAAALYTMHLSSLWERFKNLLVDPAEFASEVNANLSRVIKSDTSFATAICGMVDLKKREFRFANAGGPQGIIFHPDETHETLDNEGLPLGILEDASYEEVCVKIDQGDRLLFFSDGAFEIANSTGKMLGIEGLIEILKAQGYPQADLRMDLLDEKLLKYSNAIHLEDDLTLLEVLIQKG